ELCIAMMIYMSRSQFNPTTGSEIMGKRLGVQAFGQVGRLVGKKAEALGMKVSAIDPFIPADKIKELGAEPAKDVKELFANNDFVSVHIPATPKTIKSIGYELISSMPKNACLVNAARKEVIDEEGLEKALAEREDLKYITDLMPDNYAALKEKFGNRIFATPKKMGAQTAEANINAGIAAARQIADFFATGNTRFQVNKW
nr:3-phosphoglycerate dehydrogenase [Bacteroidales bacterium]